MSIYDEAVRRSWRGFAEAFPGEKFTKNNPQHVRFMEQQVKAHEHILTQNARRKAFGTDIIGRR